MTIYLFYLFRFSSTASRTNADADAFGSDLRNAICSGIFYGNLNPPVAYGFRRLIIMEWRPDGVFYSILSLCLAHFKASSFEEKCFSIRWSSS